MEPHETQGEIGAPAIRVASDRAGPRREFPACPACGSRLAQPVAIVCFNHRACHVERRCPECEWSGSGLFSAEAVARFEAELDAASASLGALLGSIERARMEGDTDRFAHALALNGVLPEDF